MAQEVIKTRMRYAQKQVMNVKEFLTTPKGVFETLDEIIKTFRRANKETLKAIPIKLPTNVGGKIIEKLRL